MLFLKKGMFMKRMSKIFAACCLVLSMAVVQRIYTGWLPSGTTDTAQRFIDTPVAVPAAAVSAPLSVPLAAPAGIDRQFASQVAKVNKAVEELAKANDQKKGQILRTIPSTLYPDIAKKYFLDNKDLLDFKKYGLMIPEFDVSMAELEQAGFLSGVPGWLNMASLELTSVAGFNIPEQIQNWDLSYNNLTSLDGTYFPSRLRSLQLQGNALLMPQAFSDDVVSRLKRTELDSLILDKKNFKPDDVTALSSKLGSRVNIRTR
jgi:hypothetical protein